MASCSAEAIPSDAVGSLVIRAGRALRRNLLAIGLAAAVATAAALCVYGLVRFAWGSVRAYLASSGPAAGAAPPPKPASATDDVLYERGRGRERDPEGPEAAAVEAQLERVEARYAGYNSALASHLDARGSAPLPGEAMDRAILSREHDNDDRKKGSPT